MIQGTEESQPQEYKIKEDGIILDFTIISMA